jgi:capsular polysaccharide transport system ATP-binding protein
LGKLLLLFFYRISELMIILRNITKRYPVHGNEHTVLDNINLTIRPGEKLGIIGRNGAGKSTLVRIISGADRPTSGMIQRGMRVSWPLAFSGGLQGTLTGVDNLRFICRIYNTSIDDKIPYVQDFTELGKYLHEPVKSYSSGMRARLAFALSMCIEFDCYLIDEVVAVGDDRFRARCQHELFEKRKDRAMVMVSHDYHFIKHHCAEASVLMCGKLHQFPTVDEGYSFYRDHASEQ